MKKDRNSFFSQYSMNAYNANSIPNNFYPDTNLMDRIYRLEQEIQNLNRRLEVLENKLPNINTNINYDNTMYMI